MWYACEYCCFWTERIRYLFFLLFTKNTFFVLKKDASFKQTDSICSCSFFDFEINASTDFRLHLSMEVTYNLSGENVIFMQYTLCHTLYFQTHIFCREISDQPCKRRIKLNVIKLIAIHFICAVNSHLNFYRHAIIWQNILLAIIHSAYLFYFIFSWLASIFLVVVVETLFCSKKIGRYVNER